MRPLIGIVTVLYNSESVIKDFLFSLDNQSYSNIILYVIDNKSPDYSLSICREDLKAVSFKSVIIENEHNGGIAQGNNIGIKQALKDGCELILLSNNDVVFDQKTIEYLLSGLKSNNAGMAVPKIYYHGTRQIWAAGGFFQKWSGLVLHYGDKQIDTGQFDIDRRVTYAATCFMLIDKQVFQKTGMMDERYFVYWDDTDFVYRALKRGESLWYIHDSVVFHKESTSTGYMSDFSVKYLTRNSVYFALKNYNQLYAWYVILLNIVYHVFILLFKWPFSKWKIRLESYKEGFCLYRKYKTEVRNS